jgi:ankyrin repeat protein
MNPALEEIREFVIAGHSDLEKVKQLLTAQPALLNLGYEWRAGDIETAVQAAAHMGHRPLAEYLLAQGAPLELCTAAMLGDSKTVQRFINDDPEAINTNGAHGIPLLTHAALSGDTTLTQWLFERGANTGTSAALSLVVNKRDVEMTKWLLGTGKPDAGWKNYQGKTALELATELGETQLVELLKAYQAKA